MALEGAGPKFRPYSDVRCLRCDVVVEEMNIFASSPLLLMLLFTYIG
jgi:hypothetical protein